MRLPWWGWLLVALGLLVAWRTLSVRSYRRRLRDGFVAWLREHRPTWTVAAPDLRELHLTPPGSSRIDVQLAVLTRWLAAESRAGHNPTWTAAYERLAAMVDGFIRDAHPTLERDGDRLLPRLVTAPRAAELAATGVIGRPLDGTPLHVVYVLDSEDHVTFVTRKHLDAMGLDADGVHARALANITARMPADLVRGVLSSKDLVTMKAGDGHDAARLLALPARLAPGEVLAAAVPDKDTLCLRAAGDDWETFAKVARANDGDVLLDRPLRVTSAGFEVV